jgi:hypothetical protein
VQTACREPGLDVQVAPIPHGDGLHGSKIGSGVRGGGICSESEDFLLYLTIPHEPDS